ILSPLPLYPYQTCNLWLPVPNTSATIRYTTREQCLSGRKSRLRIQVQTLCHRWDQRSIRGKGEIRRGLYQMGCSEVFHL
ncbi:hypothetical protein PFISCL1PPCAC_23809, partial [Pristionchus fissidentatus]